MKIKITSLDHYPGQWAAENAPKIGQEYEAEWKPADEMYVDGGYILTALGVHIHPEDCEIEKPEEDQHP